MLMNEHDDAYVDAMLRVNMQANTRSVTEPVIGLAEWVKNKKPMSCPFGEKVPEKFAFDITKADRIFDFLLQEG